MFYLMKIQEGKTKIVQSTEDESYKEELIKKELKINGVRMVEKESDCKLTGTYCYPLEVDKWQVLRRITEKDGWIFYGTCYNIPCFTYEFAWYDSPPENN